jgi:hypothetical protein
VLVNPSGGSWDRVGDLDVGWRPEAGEEGEGRGHHSRGGVRNVVRIGVKEGGFVS